MSRHLLFVNHVQVIDQSRSSQDMNLVIEMMTHSLGHLHYQLKDLPQESSNTNYLFSKKLGK